MQHGSITPCDVKLYRLYVFLILRNAQQLRKPWRISAQPNGFQESVLLDTQTVGPCFTLSTRLIKCSPLGTSDQPSIHGLREAILVASTGVHCLSEQTGAHPVISVISTAVKDRGDYSIKASFHGELQDMLERTGGCIEHGCPCKGAGQQAGLRSAVFCASTSAALVEARVERPGAPTNPSLLQLGHLPTTCNNIRILGNFFRRFRSDRGRCPDVCRKLLSATSARKRLTGAARGSNTQDLEIRSKSFPRPAELSRGENVTSSIHLAILRICASDVSAPLCIRSPCCGPVPATHGRALHSAGPSSTQDIRAHAMQLVLRRGLRLVAIPLPRTLWRVRRTQL